MTFRRVAIVTALALGLLPAAANAQPAGWSQVRHFTVTEGSGAALTAYQVRVVLDTATPIAAGQMRADAGDLRFGPDLAGSSFYPYWIESGVDTASTVAWVSVPSIPASSSVTVYVYFGNASATPVSALSVFDGPRSATNQVSGANTGGVTDSQRGFRFTSSVPILVTRFGKNEPNGSTRYVTLFDGSTQAVLQQIQVSGPAAQYSYTSLPGPVWLSAGHEYLLEMHQGGSDGYYFGAAPTVDGYLTFLDMRYCNACTKDTFPTNSLGGMHYGYSDFEFYARKLASPEPTVSAVSTPLVPTTTTLAASPNPASAGVPVTLTATVSPSPGTEGTIQFLDGGNPIPGCTAVPLVAGVATCVTAPIQAGTHSMTAVYSGGGTFSGSTSAVLSLSATGPSVVPVLGGPGLAALAGLVAAAGALALARRSLPG